MSEKNEQTKDAVYQDDSFERANVKVPVREKLTYSLTDAGFSAVNYLLSSYLTIYLTDVIGVAGTMVSAVLLLARIFDAINDPIIGSLADRTKTRQGRYKPWVFGGSIATAIMVTLMFSNNPDWPGIWKAIFAIVMYMLATVAMTSMYIPQIALGGVLTSNAKGRTNIATWRMIASNMGTCIIPVITMRLVRKFSNSGQVDAHGYTMAVMLICIIAGSFGIIGSLSAKERLTPPIKQRSIPVRQQMKAMYKNSAIILLGICYTVYGFVTYGRGAVLLYYFTYYVGDVDLYGIMGLAGLVGSFAGPLMLATFLHRTTRHKGRAAAITAFVLTIMYILLAFIEPRNVMWWICSGIGSMCQASFATTVFAAVPDATDLGELISGVRVDGFMSSAISLSLKIGGAIGPAVYIALYTAAGYVPNQVQNATVLKLINASVTYIPAIIVLIIGCLMLFFYKLSDARHDEIVEELIKRRTSGEE